jgi:hypothetical protein
MAYLGTLTPAEINAVPMIEASPRIEANDFLSEKCLDTVKIFVCFSQLLLRVAKDIFHPYIRTCFPHVDGERSAVFSAGQAEDVSDGLLESAVISAILLL